MSDRLPFGITPHAFLRILHDACMAYDDYDPEGEHANHQAMDPALRKAFHELEQEISWKLRVV